MSEIKHNIKMLINPLRAGNLTPIYMSILANNKDSDEIPHNVAFYQGLHCLLKQNQSWEKE